MAFKVSVGKFVERNTKEVINKILSKREVLEPAAKIALAEIKIAISKGTEPETGRPFSNPQLSEQWMEEKKILKKTNKPFDSVAGGRSRKARLIFTGQWINSFKYAIVRPGFLSFFVSKPFTIEILPDGTHEPYVDENGKRIGKRIKNRTLGRYLKDQGRNWVGIPARIKSRIIKEVQSQIRRELTKRKK